MSIAKQAKGAIFVLLLIAFSLVPIYLIYGNREAQLIKPDGFRYMGTLGGTHLLLVEKRALDNASLQKYAADYFCTEAGQTDNCEVYMFRDERDIPTSFPIIRRPGYVMGYMKRSPGKKTEFRRIYSGKTD